MKFNVIAVAIVPPLLSSCLIFYKKIKPCEFKYFQEKTDSRLRNDGIFYFKDTLDFNGEFRESINYFRFDKNRIFYSRGTKESNPYDLLIKQYFSTNEKKSVSQKYFIENNKDAQLNGFYKSIKDTIYLQIVEESIQFRVRSFYEGKAFLKNDTLIIYSLKQDNGQLNFLQNKKCVFYKFPWITSKSDN